MREWDRNGNGRMMLKEERFRRGLNGPSIIRCKKVEAKLK